MRRVLVQRLGVLALFFAVLSTSACSELTVLSVECDIVPADSLTDSADAVPFNLWVSNQSFDIDSVDIQVYVDDQQVVCDIFRVESQHTWILFELTVDPGEHTLRAVGLNGEAELMEEIDIPEERWGIVQFWTEQGRTFFSYDMQDEPIFFA